MNRFGYANQNAFSYTDPRGLFVPAIAICAANPLLCAATAATGANACVQTWNAVAPRIRNWMNSEGASSGDEVQSKPPPDTVPIDGTKWSGDHQNIKGQSGAGAADNTRVGPTGEVWVQQPGGSWVNTGNASDMIGGSEASGRNGKDREPSWKQDRGRKQRGD